MKACSAIQSLRWILTRWKLRTSPIMTTSMKPWKGGGRVGPPSNDDWEAVHRLVHFLIIFYKATLVWSATY